MAFDFEGLCRFASQSGASDIFLKEGTAPAVKINSSLRKLDHPALTKEDLEPVVKSFMTPEKFLKFQDHPDHDVSSKFASSTSLAFPMYWLSSRAITMVW
jgi:Tfp pilus assembly pilus retraction ATPase PilT